MRPEAEHPRTTGLYADRTKRPRPASRRVDGQAFADAVAWYRATFGQKLEPTADPAKARLA